MSPVPRIKLTIAYRGTAYHGWQRQSVPPTWRGPTDPGRGLPTVQELVENAVRHVVRHPLHVTGSSRTDQGVHAKGQVAHFDTHLSQIPHDGFRRAINSRLPTDINVNRLESVPDSFNSISSTIDKRYQYVVWNHENRNPMMADMVLWRWQKIDVEKMQQAAKDFVGTHDFAPFAKQDHGRKTTVRTVFDCSVSRRQHMIVIGVHGSGFLWNQIRIMVGTLLEIGENEREVDDIPRILASGDRREAGRTAGAQGLYLQWIRHAQE